MTLGAAVASAQMPVAVPTTGPLGNLDSEGRRAEQRRTLETPKRRYSKAARALFAGMNLAYGRKRRLRKFLVLELIARVPYQAWEQVAYVAITHMASRTGMARRIYDRVAAARAQQDNEQWHLLIIEELLHRDKERMGVIRFSILPQVIAFAYYQLSVVLYVIRPDWSYRLNADFEDHAEHEYMEFVAESPGFEEGPFESPFSEEYGTFASMADLLRQIGYDERIHKEESVALMGSPRFR